jgi:putative transposase
MSTAYSSDLSDKEWDLVEPLIPPAKPGGRPRTADIRAIMEAIFYVIRTGCQWRLLPHDFPAWGTVHYYYRRWRLEGTMFKIHEHLRKEVRIKYGKNKDPREGIIDSQSVKTTEKRGFGAGMRPRRSKGENVISLLIA